jgi:hypothetical protein
MAAPIGNQNAAKAKVWRAAIMRALERRTASRADGIQEIDALAEQLLLAVSSGDLGAIKEFGDRMDGKPHQSVALDGDGEGGPMKFQEVVFRSIDVPTVSGSAAEGQANSKP